jgi:hypothetical protein
MNLRAINKRTPANEGKGRPLRDFSTGVLKNNYFDLIDDPSLCVPSKLIEYST